MSLWNETATDVTEPDNDMVLEEALNVLAYSIVNLQSTATLAQRWRCSELKSFRPERRWNG